MRRPRICCRFRQYRSALLEALLHVAAEIIAEVENEAAITTAIAERSDTLIGGLYRYFRDKATARPLFLAIMTYAGAMNTNEIIRQVDTEISQSATGKSHTDRRCTGD
jgi:AcrR family transcriptional regulator